MDKRKKKEGVYQRNGSSFWWISYTDTSGKRTQKSSGTTDKREAVRVRNKWVTEEWNKTVRGVPADRTFAKVTFEYLQGTMKIKRSHATDIKKMRPLAKFFPEELVMNTLNGKDVRAYIVDRRQDGVCNNTINKELSLLSTAIKWCNSELDWELPNPVAGKRQEVEVKEARCLSINEVTKLVQSAQKARSRHTRNYFPEFCILGFYTGMRSGELLNLEWKRVDLVDRTVTLLAKHTKEKRKKLVALNDGAYEAMLRLKRIADQHCPDTPWVFTHTRPRCKGVRIQSVRKVWETTVKRAGIAWCTPHCLRHTHITEMVHAEGANLSVVARGVGHGSTKTTERYIHTADERLHDAVSKLQTIVTF
jgi:integrase